MEGIRSRPSNKYCLSIYMTKPAVLSAGLVTTKSLSVGVVFR